jgi:hypothetical protein
MNDNQSHNAEEVETWITVQKWRKVAHKVVTGVLVAAVCSIATIIRAHDLAVVQHAMQITALQADKIQTLAMFTEIRADIKRILERLPHNTAKVLEKRLEDLEQAME